MINARYHLAAFTVIGRTIWGSHAAQIHGVCGRHPYVGGQETFAERSGPFETALEGFVKLTSLSVRESCTGGTDGC